VKKALVFIRHGQERGVGALTDSSGAFRLDDLDPGSYTISAERTGFVLEPGAERTVVNVKPSPDESDVTLKMIRTGAISGRILDSDGEPITGAAVQVVPLSQRAAASNAVFNAITNDRGEYRSFNIPPGKYHLAVSYEPTFQQRQIKIQRPRPPPGNAPTGNVTSEDTYAVTYYPAAPDPKLAQTIELEAGADLQGYDVQILHARGVTVRGTVSGAAGAPAGAIVFVTLSPTPRTIISRGYTNLIQGPSNAFEIPQVLPGTYVLAATAPLGDKSLSAHQTVEIGSANVEGLQLTLAPPQTISGSIVLPEGRKLPPGLVAVLEPRDNRGNAVGGGLTQPGSDGAFQFRDISPGDYDVVLGSTGPGDDLYVSAIQAGDEDALSLGVHVGSQAVGRLKVILKANGGSAKLSVRDSDGKPLPDSWVRLVPDSPRRTQMALYGECKTDAGGACEMQGVAPGSYHAFAFAEQKQIDFRDPAATADIEDSGTALHIAEGEHQAIELTQIHDDK
jgi:hypothetical protein